ncbi:MAG: hypothetical protein ABIC95_01440 [archaeon]
MAILKAQKKPRRPSLAVVDKIVLVAIVMLLGLMKPDLVVMTAYVLLYPYLFFTGRKKAFSHLLLATGLSLIWIVIGNSQYGYNQSMSHVFGFNLFPFFAWAIGLFASYILYAHWEHVLKTKAWYKRLLFYLAIYWPLLILLEWLAFHILMIRNVATGIYPGLPLCDCMHAPGWMKAVYLALGPIYFSLCSLLGLENPHKKS